MGATGWSYFTPFQQDVEKALQELRNEVFVKGKFGQANALPPDVLAQMPAELKAAFENLRAHETARQGGYDRQFASIEELLETTGEDGTHTIVDILHTGEGPDFGVAWPAPPEVVEEVFGKAKPTHAEIEKAQGQLTEKLELERWQAVFVTVYLNEQPTEIYFEGVSGD
jgi:hypothetical protein